MRFFLGENAFSQDLRLGYQYSMDIATATVFLTDAVLSCKLIALQIVIYTHSQSASTISFCCSVVKKQKNAVKKTMTHLQNLFLGVYSAFRHHASGFYCDDLKYKYAEILQRNRMYSVTAWCKKIYRRSKKRGQRTFFVFTVQTL